jgi:hypothetical protein
MANRVFKQKYEYDGVSLVEIVERVERKAYEKEHPVLNPVQQFFERYDPMNSEHTEWFKKFARQSLHPETYKYYVNKSDKHENMFINNPFNIHVTPSHMKYASDIIYYLSAKYTLNEFNIPLPK